VGHILLDCRAALAEGDDEALRVAERSMVLELLKAQFGSSSLNEKTGEINVTIPSNQVTVDWEADTVACEPADAALIARVQACLDRIRAALDRIHPATMSGKDTDTRQQI
jgi:Pre-mRNA 3'-end-processing endonuclease polyadenylation factor C-term